MIFYLNLILGWTLSVGSLMGMIETNNRWLWFSLVLGLACVICAAENDSAWSD